MAAPMNTIVVPWINRDEFCTVYKELYSNYTGKKQHAVNRIKAWKSRYDKLPVAIATTVELQSVIIAHQKALLTNTVNEEEEHLRREYSLAIVRFVNHVTEAGQKKEFARPIIAIAREFGIPDWIVHLRHEVTHSTLPALDVLTQGVQTALQWLKETFWEHQMKDVKVKPTLNSQKKNKVINIDTKKLLRSYFELRLQEIKNGSCNGASNSLLSDLKTALSYRTHRKLLLTDLCEEDFMALSSQNLEFLGIQLEDLQESDILVLPNELLLLWRPLLKSVKKLGYGSEFVNKLIDNLDDENCLKSRQIAGWIYHLTFHWENLTYNKKGIYMCFIPSPSYSSMVQKCLQKSNPYSKLLLQHFCKQSSAYEEKQEDLVRLIDINDKGRVITGNGYSVTSSDDPDSTIYTLQDVLPKHRKLVGRWEHCTDSNIDWSTVPLGCLPGQILYHQDLEILDVNNELGHTDIETNFTISQTSNEEEVNTFGMDWIQQGDQQNYLSQEQREYIKNKTLAFLTY
ncbi:uncharacterized protein LOC126809719 [Patella vulgata]|uniref:uncharacterized protein LOC126809719 n=1 Tax=Patella vulgata TaxID=6465 RepID=UPI0024A90096|nr:uncharacterized protein LOC126809719 [Patella vulgata]